MAVHRRAFALILVLVATSATFALAIQGAVAMRTAMAEAAAMRQRVVLRREAMSAASIALAALTAGEPLRESSFGSSGGTGGGAAPDIDESELPDMPPEMKELLIGLLQKNKKPETEESAGEGRSAFTMTRSGGALGTLRKRGVTRAAIPVTIDDAAFDVTIMDAAGGVNLNIAEEEQLVRFFRAHGLVEPRTTALAHEILDWRDEDSVPRSRGVERDQYVSRGVTIRNGDFQLLEELLYLPSMTPELFAAIRDDVTLLGDGAIHVGGASRATLLSLPDMTEQALARLLQLREAGKLTEQSVKEALGALSQDAAKSLRIEPSSLLRLRITRNGGPSFSADAIVSDDEGVRILNLRMISG